MQIDRPNQVPLSSPQAATAGQRGRRHHFCARAQWLPLAIVLGPMADNARLVATMDWATRKVMSWRLSNTLHADFCVDALNEAIAKHGPPEIMNTDQGSQFTGSAWRATLSEAGVRISMEGRGRYLPSHRFCETPAGQRINIFIERLWWSLKQEAIYLEEISDGFQARRVVRDWMTFYNTKRPHSALDRHPPDDAYWVGLDQQKAA